MTPLPPRCFQFKAWLGLGVCERRPLFAQHAFIRAVQLGSGAAGESAVAWTNLGMLYIEFDAPDLARPALAAAQCADPSNEAVWLGHGLLNQRVGPQGVSNAVAAYLSAVELRPSTDALLAAAFSQLNLFPGVPAETGTQWCCWHTAVVLCVLCVDASIGWVSGVGVCVCV